MVFILASLFTYIINHAKVPDDWTSCVKIPRWRHQENSCQQGVRQVYLLAILIYIKSFIDKFNSTSFHPWKLENRQCSSVLLYAVLFSHTHIGLKQVFHILAEQRQEEQLEINDYKIEVVVFARYLKAHIWWLNNHSIKQVKTFKYIWELLSILWTTINSVLIMLNAQKYNFGFTMFLLLQRSPTSAEI